jgi:HK97 family phage portal protein
MRLFGWELSLRKSYPAGSSPIRPSGYMGSIHEPFAGGWQGGMTAVDPIGTLTTFGAVFACISRICDDVSKLEPELLTPGADDIPEHAPATSPYWRVLQTPNQFQNRIQFLSFWLACKLMFGNAYHIKEREDIRGIVRRLYPLDPRKVTPMVTPSGDVYYSLGGDDLARVPQGMVVPASEIIHDRGVTLWHPLVGISPLYASALSATQGLRIQRNSAQFFENMSRPSGMLTAPGVIDDVTAERLKREWESNYSRSNIGRLAVLGDGLEYEAMTMPAEASQLIQQLEWTAKDIAGSFHVPLYKIGVGPMPTNNNVEALDLQYYTGCLQVLIESIELCLTQGLEVPANYFVELSLDGLLRMDSGAQVEMLTKAAGGAFMTPDEARKRRRLPKVDGGGALYRQQQDHTLAALAKRDAGPDPFGKAAPAAAPNPAAEQATGDKQFRAWLTELTDVTARATKELQHG